MSWHVLVFRVLVLGVVTFKLKADVVLGSVIISVTTYAFVNKIRCALQKGYATHCNPSQSDSQSYLQPSLSITTRNALTQLRRKHGQHVL